MIPEHTDAALASIDPDSSPCVSCSKMTPQDGRAPELAHGWSRRENNRRTLVVSQRDGIVLAPYSRAKTVDISSVVEMVLGTTSSRSTRATRRYDTKAVRKEA